MLAMAFIAVAILSCGNATAQTRKKSSVKSKKTSSVLPVTKGEIKEYGDFLTTQIFTVKKGKDNKISIEYPISGDPDLVNAMRRYIKNCLNENFTGSLDTPDALLRNALKGKKDVSFGQEGESLEQNFKVIYNNQHVITLDNTGYTYMGGAHGMGWNSGTTFLIENGTEFSESMLPSISKMRPFILQGLAKSYNVSTGDLSDILLTSPNEIDYPGTIYITGEGITFIYQPYEIAPWSEGTPTSVVPVTNDILNMLTPEGRKFF